METTREAGCGALLRYWRGVRGMSQLDMALSAGVSARHVSFVETGRSRPSREMTLLLAHVLDVPLRERNALLLAAGHAPQYRETDLSAPEMATVRRSIEFLLERHDPYPAVVCDRRWNLCLQNRAAQDALARFVAAPAAVVLPLNVMRLLFSPHGVRPFIVNWTELAGAMIQRLQREAVSEESGGPVRALLEELLAEPGVPAAWRRPDYAPEGTLLVPLRVRRDGVELSLFSAITTLGTPQDITLQELRLETFFPADDATDAQLRAWAPSRA